MSAFAALEDALQQVLNQEARVQLLEKLLIMILLNNGGGIAIPSKFADDARDFDGYFDIGSGVMTLVSAKDAQGMPPPGVSIRTFARGYYGEDD